MERKAVKGAVLRQFALWATKEDSNTVEYAQQGTREPGCASINTHSDKTTPSS